MEYTDYMDQCCDALAKAQEYPIDALIVAAVRIQQLLLYINRVFPERTTAQGRSTITASDSHAIITIGRRLDEVISHIPDELKASRMSN